jgi:c-di-GMP-binding flagellar brake protein YcgR
MVHRTVPYPKDSMTCKGMLELSATWEGRHVLFQYGRGILVCMERRRHRRVSAQVKSLLRANSHEVEGETVDLSLGGARIESSLVVQPGRQIAVKLIVPGDDTPILIEQAQVQWAVDQTFGVRFVDLPQHKLDELEQLIDESVALDEGRET